MIDNKLGNLENLATFYKDDTAMLRGNQELANEAVEVVTNSITKTELGKQGTSPDVAFTIETEEDFDKIPLDAWFINPSDGLAYQKTGERG